MISAVAWLLPGNDALQHNNDKLSAVYLLSIPLSLRYDLNSGENPPNVTAK